MKIDMIVSTVNGDKEFTEISRTLPCVGVDGFFCFAGRDKMGKYDFHKIPAKEVKTASIFFTHEEGDVHPQV